MQNSPSHAPPKPIGQEAGRGWAAMGNGLLQFLQQAGDADAVLDDLAELLHGDALLLHRVAIAQRDRALGEGIAIDGDAERRTDGVLAAVALADGVLHLDVGVEVELQAVDDLLCLLGQSVFVDERQDGTLHGSERLGQAQDDALRSVVELLLGVGVAEDGEEHAVHADRCLYVIRGYSSRWYRGRNT